MVRANSASHRWKVALSVAWLAPLSWGCEHTVALGTECPPIGQECIDSTNRPPRPPPVEAPDAGNEPKPEPDAGATPDPSDSGAPVPDSGVDEPDASVTPSSPFPGFRNPSFELTSGAPNGGNLGALSSAAIEPWSLCSGIVSARPEDDLRNAPIGGAEEGDLIHPSDQSTLVSMSFGFTGPGSLSQELASPLVKGQRYAFVVDVVRSGSADARLQVWGSNGCVPLERLAESEMIVAEGQDYQTVCMSFVPTSDFTNLILLMSPVTGARIFIDHIRASPSCL